MKRFTTLTFLILLLCQGIQARNFQNNDTTKVKNHEEYKKFRVGSYGEMLFQHMDYGPYRLETAELALRVINDLLYRFPVLY